MRITKIPLDWFYRKDPDWVKYREGFQQYGYEEVVIDSRSEYRRTGGRVLSIYNKKVDKVPIIIPIFPVDIEEVELEACDWLAEAALERVLNDYRSIDD